MGDAGSAFWEHAEISIVAVVIANLLGYAPLLTLDVVTSALRGAHAPIASIVAAQVFFLACGWLIQTWLGIGQALFFLRAARSNTPSLGDLFRGGRYLPRVLAALVLLALIAAGVVVLSLLPAGIVWLAEEDRDAVFAATLAGGIIGVVLLGYLALACSQFLYLIVDQGVGPLKSLAASSRITVGNKRALILLTILALLMQLAGLFPCGVGLLVSLPLTMYVGVIAYLEMTAPVDP